MNETEKKIFKDLRFNEVQYLIDEGIFEFFCDHKAMIDDAKRFLPHHYNPRFLIRIGPGPNVFLCRKFNNRLMIQGNTKNIFKYLQNEWLHECIKGLSK